MNVSWGGGVDWSAVVGFLNVVVTGGLLWAAVNAWKSAQAQLRVMEDARKDSQAAADAQLQMMEKTRTDAQRPVLIGKTAWTSPGDVIVLRVENVGPGPALRVRVRGWDKFRELPSYDEDPTGYDEIIDGERTEVARTQPRLSGGTSVIAPNAHADILMRDRVEPWVPDAAMRGRLYYRIEYDDIFKNTFHTPEESERAEQIHHAFGREPVDAGGT